MLSVCGYHVDFVRLVFMQELFSIQELAQSHIYQMDQIIVYDSAIIE